MQVQGICSHRLLHREVVETPSNYRDLTCGELEIPLAVTLWEQRYQKDPSSYSSWTCLWKGGEGVA